MSLFKENALHIVRKPDVIVAAEKDADVVVAEKEVKWQLHVHWKADGWLAGRVFDQADEGQVYVDGWEKAGHRAALMPIKTTAEN